MHLGELFSVLALVPGYTASVRSSIESTATKASGDAVLDARAGNFPASTLQLATCAAGADLEHCSWNTLHEHAWPVLPGSVRVAGSTRGQK